MPLPALDCRRSSKRENRRGANMQAVLSDHPRWSAYVCEIWDYRYFWMSLVRIDLRNRYKRSVLGVGWSLLQPIAMTSVLCFCFHAVFEIGLADYVPLLMTGMAFWALVSGCITDGCQTFYQAQGYIKAERIPLAVYSLRTALTTTLHFSITIAVAVVVTGLFRGIESVVALATLLPTIALLLLFGWSLATLMAFAAVHFPDVPYLSTIGLQILFYLTPVMYPPSIVESRGLGDVLRFNPLGYFLQLLRDPLLAGKPASPQAYAIACALTALTVGAALIVIRRKERQLIFSLI